jgi:hypothetical protein
LIPGIAAANGNQHGRYDSTMHQITSGARRLMLPRNHPVG